MRRHETLLVIAVLVVTGCHHGMWSPFQAPGSKEVQQRTAVIHDPYPQNDIATPLPDGRPRDYMSPPAETVRTRASDALRVFPGP